MNRPMYESLNKTLATRESQRAVRGHLVALATLIVLTILMTYPLAFNAWGTITNYGDPLLNTWIMAWDLHALTTDPINLYNANIFHPYSNTLAYSENLVGLTVLAAPIIWLTGNPVFAYNVLVLLSFVLSGFGAYLLVRHLTGSWYGGLIAGLIFAFSPFRFGQFSHIQLLTVQWLPLVFLFLTRFFGSHSLRDALLFALFLTWQCLSCTYYAFYTVTAVALYLAYRVLIHRREGRPLDRALFGKLGLALALAVMLVTPVLLPYFDARDIVGDRDIEHLGGAAIENYLGMPSNSLLGHIPPFNSHGISVEETLFPGFVVLALSVIAWKTRRTRQTRGPEDTEPVARSVPSTELLFYAFLGIVAFVLSLGPSLRLTVDGQDILGPLPYVLLHEWIPGFKAMRVPARFAILVVLASAVLAGYGATWLAHRRGHVLRAIIAFAIIVEFLAIPVPSRPIEVGAEVPEVYHWLNQLPEKTVILELPATTSPWFWVDETSMQRLARQQYLTTYHWNSSIMGYSGFYPPLFWESIDRILHFPSTESISYLRGMGVHYIVVHRAEMTPEDWESLQRKLPLFSDQVNLIETVGQDYIYALSKPIDAPQTVQIGVNTPVVSATASDYCPYISITNPNDATCVHQTPPRYVVTYRWRHTDGTTSDGEVRGLLDLTHPEGTSYSPVVIPRPDRPCSKVEVTVQALGQVATAVGEVRTEVTPGEEFPLPPQEDSRRLLKAGVNYSEQAELSHVALGADSYRAGDSLDITLYWHKLVKPITADYVVFVKVLNQSRTDTVAQINMAPTRDRQPTSSWSVGEMIVDRHLLQLPFDLEPGQYSVIVGLYDQETQQSLKIVSEGESPESDSYETKITVY